MPKIHKPRRGSLRYSPRCRARSHIPRIKSWPSPSGKTLPGFVGYKVGVTHILVTENRKTSPLLGQERNELATIIEAPPLVVVGFRAYLREIGRGLKAAGEVWSEKAPKRLERKTKATNATEAKKPEFDAAKIESVRLILATQPHLAGFGKKKPDVIEMPAPGKDSSEKIKNAEGLLGSEIKLSDVITAGDYMDVFSISKGKGFQGPVKKWGVKLQSRKTKNAQRRPGNIGGWTPKITQWYTPMGGQMGYQQRGEFNKRVYSIGSGGIEHSGGWKNYGLVRGDYIILGGSVAGPSTRLIKLRFAMRTKNNEKNEIPEITYIHEVNSSSSNKAKQ